MNWSRVKKQVERRGNSTPTDTGQAATSLHYHGCPQCKTLLLLRDSTDRLCFIKHTMECQRAESKSFQCFNCTQRFATYKQFKGHFPTSGCAEKNNVCPLCEDFISADKESRKGTANSFGCTQCDKSFTSASTFKLHQIAQHLNKGNQEYLTFDLECEQCKYSFETDVPFIYSNYYIFNRIICGDCISHMESRMLVHPMVSNLQAARPGEGGYTPVPPHKSTAQLPLSELPRNAFCGVELEPYQNALEKYEQRIEDLFILYQNSFKFKPTCLICPVQNEIRHESLKRLRFHYNKHHRMSKLFCIPKNLRCWDCYSTTKRGNRVRFNFSQISTHLFKYHYEIQCVHCSLQFNCQKTLYKHFSNAHPNLDQTESINSYSEDSKMCFICGDILPAGVDLENHVLKHNEALEPSVVICHEKPKTYKIMLTPFPRHTEKPKPYHKVLKPSSTVPESSVLKVNEIAKRYYKILESPVVKDCEQTSSVQKVNKKPLMLKCSHCLKVVKEGEELINHVQKHHPNIKVIKVKQIGNANISMPDI